MRGYGCRDYKQATTPRATSTCEAAPVAHGQIKGQVFRRLFGLPDVIITKSDFYLSYLQIYFASFYLSGVSVACRQLGLTASEVKANLSALDVWKLTKLKR